MICTKPATNLPKRSKLIFTPGMSKFMKKSFIADADVNEAEVIHATVDIDLLQEACDISWLALTVSFSIKC